MTIQFQAQVGQQPFVCGQRYQGIGLTGSTIIGRDFRFYVSNVRLVERSGKETTLELDQDGKWQLDDLALLDFENGTGSCSNGTPEMNTVIKGSAPAGEYTGLRFTLGVPFNKNHLDPLSQPSPLNLSSMMWVWNAGHKFARLDFASSGMPRGFFVHVGSTGCTPNKTRNTIPTSCKAPNRVEVGFPSFDPARDVVIADLAALLQNTNLDSGQDSSAAESGSGGCMSGPNDAACAGLFLNLGLPFGNRPAGEQKLWGKRRGRFLKPGFDPSMRNAAGLLVLACLPVLSYDAHGRANAPIEARHLRSPLHDAAKHLEAGREHYETLCASCHGMDGAARTTLAGTLLVRPADLANPSMDLMREGEIYWVIAHGVGRSMPAFESKLDETQRWEVVEYVRELRKRHQEVEVAQLGPYKWDLPPGFPYPNVPADNLMTAEKVELGRRLFYDERMSLNQTQSCATCHQQQRAFADARGRGLGSTGELHPRGPMSLVNVAYSPVLTWANPNLRSLETQALVPMFGDSPVELGLSGKEETLLARLKGDARYRVLFAGAFPGDPDPITIANVTKALASFERTILSGDSPYDRYRRGDDANAISGSAKRGEALFFGERLECFHCHGGFNFTGTVDYYGKGLAEIEFHNTGLYNIKGPFSYPDPNLGLYVFTQQPEDVGKFKAPTLRNIALTAPYLHDGSIATLAEAIEHYAAGGRTIKSGALSGNGSMNPNRSDFVQGFKLRRAEKADVMAFLLSLTDETLRADRKLSNPWVAEPAAEAVPHSRYVLRAEVVQVFPEDESVALYNDKVPGLFNAAKAPNAREYLVADPDRLKLLKPGQFITAFVRKQGRDYVLEDLRPQPHTGNNR